MDPTIIPSASTPSPRRALLLVALGGAIGLIGTEPPHIALAGVAALAIVAVAFRMVGRVVSNRRPRTRSWEEVRTLILAPRRLSRELMKFIVALGLTLLALNLYAPAHPTPTERFLASLIMVFAALPTVIWLWGRDPGIPFLPLFGCIYAAHYALPVFLLDEYTRLLYDTRTFPHPVVEKTLLLSFLGLCFLLIGHYGTASAVRQTVPKLRMGWKDSRTVELIAVLFGMVGVSAYYVRVAFSIPVVVAQGMILLTDFSLLSGILLFILQLTGRIGFLAKTFLWGILFPSRVLLGLGTGATFQGLQVVLTLIMVYATVRRRLPWKLMLIGFAAFLFVRAVQVPFRDLTWEEGAPAATPPTEKAMLFLMIARESAMGQHLPFGEAFKLSFFRISHLMTFAEVVEVTPSEIPFWGGETYRSLFFKLVPRFLYADKPTEELGQVFGHRYGFLAPDDFLTSYNLPQLVELYANYGLIGVLIGMSLIGILYRTLNGIVAHREIGLGAAVSVIYILTGLLNMESNAGIVFGNLPWQLIFLGLVHLLMNVVERPGSRHSA